MTGLSVDASKLGEQRLQLLEAAKIDSNPLELLKLAGKAAFRSGIQEPLAGAGQLANHLAGREIFGQPDWVKPSAPAQFGSTAWLFETVGSGVGMVAPFMATEAASSKLLSASARLSKGLPLAESMSVAFKESKFLQFAAPVAKATVDGAAYGLVFTPSNDATKGFWEQRAVSAAAGGLTFGTQAGVSRGLMHGLGKIGAPMEDALFMKTAPGLALRIGSNALGGGAAGFVSAESNSLLSGNGLASGDAVKQSMATFIVTGGALDAFHMAKDSFAARRQGTVAGPDTTSDALRDTTATTRSAMDASGAAPPPGGMETSFAPEVRDIGHRVLASHVGDYAGRADKSSTAEVSKPPVDPLGEPLTIRQRAQSADPLLVEPSPATRRAAKQFELAVAEQLQGLDPLRAEGHKADFRELSRDLASRERDATSPVTRQQIQMTFDAVNRLLTSDTLQVNMPAEQQAALKVGLAKQILTEAANPWKADQGRDLSCGPAAAEQMALHTDPGKQARAIVDLLTTGKYTTGGPHPKTIDLTPETLAKLPPEYRDVLSPDAQARRSIFQAAETGREPTRDGERSYASQLAQLLAGNIRSQALAPEGQQAIYVKGKPDRSNPYDTGERLFQAGTDGNYRPVLNNDGSPKIGPGLETRDIQPIYDALTGRNSARDNFVLMNTTEPIDASQGSRFLSANKLQSLLTRGNKPFVVEVNASHDLFGANYAEAVSPAGAPARHVVIVEPAMDPSGIKQLQRDGQPLFSVIDTYGSGSHLTGDRAVTAKELYEATRQPNERQMEGPTELNGLVQNYGRVDEGFYRGRKPGSREAIQALKAEGTTLIIDLIEGPKMANDGTGRTQEQVWAEEAGIRYINLKTSVKNFSEADVNRVIAEAEAEIHPTDGRPPGKVFMHCAKGVDRTGAIAARYQQRNDGLPAMDALRGMELFKSTGVTPSTRRMRQLVEFADDYTPRVDPNEAKPESREIGGRATDFQHADLAKRIESLADDTQSIKSSLIGTGQDDVFTTIAQQLRSTGLSESGWTVFPTQVHSPADMVGSDFLLVNKNTGELHLLDATGNAEKDPPSIRKDGVIFFRKNWFGMDSPPEADALPGTIGDMLKYLTSQPTLLNLKDMPFPDYRQIDMPTAAKQIGEFATWLNQKAAEETAAAAKLREESREHEARQREFNAELLKEYAKDIEKKALSTAVGKASERVDPHFTKTVQDTATSVLLDWIIKNNSGRNPAGVADSPSTNIKSDVHVFQDKQDAKGSKIKLRTADGEVIGGDITDIMLKARSELIAAFSDLTAGRTSSDPATASLASKISHKLERAGLNNPTGLRNAAQTLQNRRSQIELGGKLGDGRAEISETLQQTLRARSEGSLLGTEQKPEPKVKVDMSPVMTDTQQAFESLGVNKSSTPEDVITAMQMALDDHQEIWTSGQKDRFTRMIEGYTAGNKDTKKVVTKLLPAE